MKYYIAIDAGTSVIKTVIFNTNFKHINSYSVKNPVITDKFGKSEIEMEKFWSLTAKCIKLLIKKSKIQSQSIVGLGITGNMVGFWSINNKNKPVRNAILWNDTRSQKIFTNKKIFDQIYKITGSITQYGCTIPILKWMTKFESENLKKIKYILTCKDWLRFKLTGNINNDETEVSVYPGDIKNKKLSKKIFKIFNLSTKYFKLFPEIKKSNELGGYVTKSASKLTNLRVGTPVIIGCGDVIASILGAGGINHNKKISIIGTTCHNIIVKNNSKISQDGSGLFFASLNNTWLETKINVAGTTNIDWVIDNFYKNPKKYSDKIKIINNFEKKYLTFKYPENSLIFLPYINYGGSISPFVNLNSKAEIFGILPHHNNFDIMTACYEGLALSIKDCYANKIKTKDSLYLAGGASKSKVLPQLISNVLNTKVKILNNSELGALGISFLIDSYLHKKDLKNLINDHQNIGHIYTPQRKHSKYLNNKYQKYKKLRESLNNIW